MIRRHAIGKIVLMGVLPTALLLYLLFRPVNNPDFERPSLARVRNTSALAGALAKYQFEHDGRLPSRLSDLVPKYVPPSNIRFFFPPNAPRAGSSGMTPSASLLTAIDEEGAYGYLGEKGIEQDLILYERPGKWTVNNGETNLMTLSSNFTRMQRSWEEIEARIGNMRNSIK